MAILSDKWIRNKALTEAKVVHTFHSYDAEQQAAAERLGEKVASIVADEQP